MKHTKLAGILLASIAFLSIGTAVGVTSFNNTKEIDAASQSDIDTYYYNVSGSGTNLLTSVNVAIRSISNVGYSGLKTAYTYTDVRSDGKLYDIYSNKTNYTPGSNYAGSYQKVGDGYNREHTIPKSWWGGDESKQGSDLYIVLPSDAKANGMRSNNPYGETDSTETYKMSGDPDGNALGTSNNTNYVSGTVFEPFDDRKGDLARIYFYAVAMYWDGPTGYAAGNGAVYKWTTGDGSKVFSSSGNNGFVQKYLNMLLKWHTEDPVSDWEIARNDNVQGRQNNRNPFVDHPSWVDLIWGGTYIGANAEDTSSGSVSHGQLVSTGIKTISKTEATLNIGGTTTISATSSNSGNITWTSSNSNVATVSPGTQSSGSNVTITAVAAGSATITASITISGTTYSKTCDVTVNDPSQKTLSSIGVSSDHRYFTKGDTFVKETVTAYYSDDSEEVVTDSATFSGYNTATTGEQTVTVSYGGKSTSYTITVTSSGSSSSATIAYSDTFSPALPTTSGTVNTQSTSHTDTNSNFTFKEQGIYKGDTAEYIMFAQNKGFLFNTTSLGTVDSVAITYSSGTSTTGKIGVYFGASEQSTYTTTSNSTIKGQSKTDTFENSTSGNGFFQISTSNKNVQITEIIVTYHSSAAVKVLTGISLNTDNVQTEFNQGATFDYTGLVVTAHYSDSTTATVTPTSVSTPDMSVVDEVTITVSYTESGKTEYAYYDIEIIGKTLSSISISGQTTSFYEGDAFAFGGTVTAHYSDSSTENVTSSATFSGYTMTTTGQQTVTVSYGGESTSYNITVNAGLLYSIILSGQKTSYKVNDEFSFTGTCTAVFENEYEKGVTPTSVSSPDMSSTGDKTVTVSYTYNGRTRSTSYTISVSTSTYTGPIEEGRYYIMHVLSTGVDIGCSNATGTNHPVGVSLATTNTLGAFTFTLTANNTYSIDRGDSTNYLYCEDANNGVKLGDPDENDTDWTITKVDATNSDYEYYKLYHNSTLRYLTSYVKDSTNDFRCYKEGSSANFGETRNSNGQHSRLMLVKEGSYAEGIANRILNDVTCDNGVHAPDTSDWSSVSTAYSALTITYEKNLLINGVANEQSTNVIEQALAKYDLIIRRYGSSAYSNFLGRNISQAHNIVFANLTDNSSLIVILIAAGIVGVGFVSLVLLKRRKHN